MMLHLNTFLSFIVNIYCDESITLTRSVSLDRFLLLILSSLKVNGSTLLFYQTSNSSHYSVALGIKRLVVPGVDASIRKQYTNGRMDEWVDERTDAWMDGWTSDHESSPIWLTEAKGGRPRPYVHQRQHEEDPQSPPPHPEERALAGWDSVPRRHASGREV